LSARQVDKSFIIKHLRGEKSREGVMKDLSRKTVAPRRAVSRDLCF
jgi:hypothetical protein